jgi:H+/gluconate symporter-like permease
MKFNLVFSSLLAIALTSGITAVGLSAQPNPNDQQIAVQTTCLDTWKLCAGAIVGLVGGRNLTGNDQTDKK